MPARGEQQQIGEVQIVCQARCQRMRLEMVDGQDRLAETQGDGLARGQSHQDPADQARASSCGHSIEIGQADPRLFHRLADQPIEDIDMGAGGDFGNDAAKRTMLGDLRADPVRQDPAGAVPFKLDNGSGGLVAGCFDTENANHAATLVLNGKTARLYDG